jgi:hypothetical protein
MGPSAVVLRCSLCVSSPFPGHSDQPQLEAWVTVEQSDPEAGTVVIFHEDADLSGRRDGGKWMPGSLQQLQLALPFCENIVLTCTSA